MISENSQLFLTLNLFLISFITEKTTDIVVTWSTFNDSLSSRVQYGKEVMDKDATGSAKLFVDGGKQKRHQWIHNVVLRDLEPNTKYSKTCYGGDGSRKRRIVRFPLSSSHPSRPSSLK